MIDNVINKDNKCVFIQFPKCVPNIASLAYGSAKASMYNNPFELFVNTLFIRIAVPRIRDARAVNVEKSLKKV